MDMKRSDLHILAEARVADAEALLQGRRWAAAYYLLGYAVECALKACAAKQFHEHEVPEKKFVIELYTHELGKLLNLSGVKASQQAQATADPRFEVNWNTVRDWNETYRYDHSTTETKARDMLIAVTDPSSGVLPWLKTQW